MYVLSMMALLPIVCTLIRMHDQPSTSLHAPLVWLHPSSGRCYLTHMEATTSQLLLKILPRLALFLFLPLLLKYKLNRADWTTYSVFANDKMLLEPEPSSNLLHSYSSFVTILLEAADAAIPKKKLN